VYNVWNIAIAMDIIATIPIHAVIALKIFIAIGKLQYVRIINAMVAVAMKIARDLLIKKSVRKLIFDY
jgi:hypothetical protein